LFTPWDTQCHVPPDFDPLKTVIARLTSKSSDDENKVEINRIHAVLHPDCFGRLVAAFGYRPPEERMELPRFFLDQTDDQSPPRQRRAPADLSAEELAEINGILAEQAGRRRRSSPTAAIRIMVDGVERATLNPVEQSSISFSVQEDAETIEVKTTDSRSDLLLATHLVTSYREDAYVSSIRLEGGQELSLSITRRQIEANGATDLLVTFGYQETDPRRAARLWWQRLGLFAGAISGRHIVVVSSVVIICVVSYLGYVRLRSRQTVGPAQITRVQPTPQVSQVSTNQPATIATPQPVRPRTERSTATKVPDSAAKEVPVQIPDEDVAEDVMRSGSVVPNLKLRDVKKIYIEMRGEAAVDELRRNLVENLESSGVVAVAAGADEADAALKIDIRSGPPIQATALLVNARGNVLWRGTRRYSGEIPKVVSEIVKDLLSEIRRHKNTK
jgi:hypothetical protein